MEPWSRGWLREGGSVRPGGPGYAQRPALRAAQARGDRDAEPPGAAGRAGGSRSFGACLPGVRALWSRALLRLEPRPRPRRPGSHVSRAPLPSRGPGIGSPHGRGTAQGSLGVRAGPRSAAGGLGGACPRVTPRRRTGGRRGCGDGQGWGPHRPALGGERVGGSPEPRPRTRVRGTSGESAPLAHQGGWARGWDPRGWKPGAAGQGKVKLWNPESGWRGRGRGGGAGRGVGQRGWVPAKTGDRRAESPCVAKFGFHARGLPEAAAAGVRAASAQAQEP